jgi:tetratricopeptide (TPR) repeat protein
MSPVERSDLMDQLLGDPTSESALVALHVMEDDDPAACSELLARASERCSDDAVASDWLAEAARLITTRCGDLQRGLELWSRALKRDPLNARAAEELAREFRRAGDDEGLELMLTRRARALERLAARDSDIASLASRAYEALGIHYAETTGELDAAVQALRRALELSRLAGGLVSIAPRRALTQSSLRHRSVEALEPESKSVPAVDTLPVLAPPRNTQPDALLSTRARTTPSPPPAEAIDSSEDRLMGLFEALHPVQACEEVIEGAVLLLDILVLALEADAGVVHLYDSATGEFEVVAAAGPGYETVLRSRTNDTDALLALAMTEGSAVIVAAGATELAGRRWTALAPRRSVICAPAFFDARCLGAIELIDPANRIVFDAQDRHAMTYAGERLANFLAERGCV